MSACPAPPSPAASFASRLMMATVRTGSVLCVGIDPHPSLMPPLFGGPDQCPGTDQALCHLHDFSHAVLEAATGRVPAIKPQVAFFERHGHAGMRILAELALEARKRDLLVIMDGKRGDIGTTAQAYAEAWLGPDAVFASDALTINPYLGFDSLAPFVSRAGQTRSGLFILLRTSNPGSADLQQQVIEGRAVWAHIAGGLADYVTGLIDPSCGLSCVGVVVGATGPADAAVIRRLLPAAPFLIPGYGVQGGGAADALSGLIKDRDTGRYTGGLVSASRTITHGAGVQSATTLTEAVQAMAEAIMSALHDLGGACDRGLV